MSTVTPGADVDVGPYGDDVVLEWYWRKRDHVVVVDGWKAGVRRRSGGKGNVIHAVMFVQADYSTATDGAEGPSQAAEITVELVLSR